MLKQKEIADIFSESEAFLEGHFLLTSGSHSPNYFQCAKVLQYPQYTSMLCQDIASRFQNVKIDKVISPAIGGIVVGTEVARHLNKPSIFTEREEGEMTVRRGFAIEEGEKLLLVEDVLTTGKSIKEVIKLINERKGVLVGVGLIVDRSGGTVKFNCQQESLMQMDVIKYEKENCPLCKEGIELVKPGSRKIKD